jgi:hypothetical protein
MIHTLFFQKNLKQFFSNRLLHSNELSTLYQEPFHISIISIAHGDNDELWRVIVQINKTM